VKTYGGLHCAFNNAGVLPPMSMLADTEESTFDQTFAVDVKGVFLTMKYEIQQMLKTGRRDRQQRFDSRPDCGTRHQHLRGGEACGHRFVESSRDRVRQSGNSDQRDCTGIGGNAYDQALVRRSEMRNFFLANSPIGRFAQPEEIANMVLFLCSDLASFAAGQTFAVDGGYTAR
jgi:Dehydrogenases with different specificities (related to short-chain alcohol dehydrogenases)